MLSTTAATGNPTPYEGIICPPVAAVALPDSPCATDSARTLGGGTDVAPTAPDLISLTAPPATASPAFRPDTAGGAASSLRYRRTYGSGRWTQRHITTHTSAVILRAFAAESGRSPDWDATVDQPDHLATARTVAEASGYLHRSAA